MLSIDLKKKKKIKIMIHNIEKTEIYYLCHVFPV